MKPVHDTYRELLDHDSNARHAFLRASSPKHARGHWWWALLERAETELIALRARPGPLRDAAQLAVDIIESAIDAGMPAYLVNSWIARLSRRSRGGGLARDALPRIFRSDDVARRILSGFPLSQQQAVRIAERRRRDLMECDGAWFDGSVHEESPEGHAGEERLLQEIEYLLPELEVMVNEIADAELVESATSWLALREQFEVGPGAVRRGRDLLRRPRQGSEGDQEG